GVEVSLLSDSIAAPALRAGCAALNLAVELHEYPLDDSGQWAESFLASDAGRRLTHLIAMERVGPSHTLQSFLAQPREGEPLRAEFERDVPPEHRNACHNMRGMAIDSCTAPTHRLFDLIRERKLPITTIGIGAGGNEIAMGQLPWEVLRSAIAHGPAGQVACRIATDFTVLAGVSNWGGYALAAALDHLAGRERFLLDWNAQREQDLLRSLVEMAGCVDGLTRRR